MPRTKAPKKKVGQVKELIKEVSDEMTEAFKKIHNQISSDFTATFISAKISYPKQIINKPLGSINKNDLNDALTDVDTILEMTKNRTLQKTASKLVKSSSFGDDEGYQTTESSNGATSGRLSSRSRSRTVTKPARPSRSLSARTRQRDALVAPKTVLSKYKTPMNKGPNTAQTYGMITPKVQPNTPQVLLRRPKQGEMAVSLQGSPLFTGSQISESIANVNIPLKNGGLLSIQPRKGLRVSQLPQLDANTRRQLETLRDNLEKVCARR